MDQLFTTGDMCYSKSRDCTVEVITFQNKANILDQNSPSDYWYFCNYTKDNEEVMGEFQESDLILISNNSSH